MNTFYIFGRLTYQDNQIGAVLCWEKIQRYQTHKIEFDKGITRLNI